KHNIDLYCQSNSWEEGKINAEYFIVPIINLLKEDDINYLLEQAVIQQEDNRYDQLSRTTDLMINLFDETINELPDTIKSWENFIAKKRDKNWKNIEELDQKIANYYSSPF
ncbi:MAG: hypothetical protein F6J98_22770, partial [Moorea sp. SIO4G2]|nr:hypothetical protein [Moorena sp. SIO4G2]